MWQLLWPKYARRLRCKTVEYGLPQTPSSSKELHTQNSLISMCRMNYHFGGGVGLEPEKYQERIAESKRSN